MKGRDAISAVTGTRFSDIRWVGETGSTNADVLRAAADGAAEGLVVVAGHQLAGRGRAGRTWTAPPGSSLLCTILLRPPSAAAPLVTFALGVAAASAVFDAVGVRVGLKWPNDLVWDDGERTRKLAGILAEAEWPTGASISAGYRAPRPDERVAVAAGIGINLSWPESVPAEVADLAVAIADLAPDGVCDRVDLLERMLVHLEEAYAGLLADGPDRLLAMWREWSDTLGRQVRIELAHDDLIGRGEDITPEGHLLVADAEGRMHEVAVGDVVHLRPEG